MFGLVLSVGLGAQHMMRVQRPVGLGRQRAHMRRGETEGRGLIHLTKVSEAERLPPLVAHAVGAQLLGARLCQD